MTAQTMSFRYELAGKDHSTEQAQDLGTWQNNLYCFIYVWPLHFILNYFLHCIVVGELGLQ